MPLVEKQCIVDLTESFDRFKRAIETDFPDERSALVQDLWHRFLETRLSNQRFDSVYGATANLILLNDIRRQLGQKVTTINGGKVYGSLALIRYNGLRD